ncbi:hypothetical protein [Methylocystis sp. SC2]|uniref:hypothetical protein n=1 Tax=Methylocystis sp. (strain SC2) TaxID=187303 RepID=UPI0011D20C63|nr:hypothetical protein [Methylocystis sp. SC2]
MTVAAGDDGEIAITFRSRDDKTKIEAIGLQAADAGILIEALSTVHDGRSPRVTIREEGNA